ncbi:hypothetical protein [Cupriavidus sp.]|uniref:hypothetical protein n=1 Tax=Cupriavidus sp. TaxID=1873897 RepID=UPI003D11290A
MRTLGLLFATSMAIALPLHANAAGCQYDMQCKGERICQKGQCVSPDDDEQDAAAQASRQPASRAAPAPAPVPAANPAQAPSSARMVKNPPPPPPPPPTSAAPAAQATSEPRFCCTVAGRLKPYNSAAFDADTNVGDACQGVTHSGKPVPGTACQ